MHHSPRRRKWTAVALIGGFIAASIGTAPAAAQQDPAAINDEIDALDDDLGAAVEEYNRLAQDAADNRELIDQTQTSLDTAEAALDAMRAQLADYLTATHVDQGVGDLALLLDAGSPDAFVERLDRLNAANLYNFALMDDLRAASAEYTTQLDLLDDLQSDLEAQEEELRQTADELTARINLDEVRPGDLLFYNNLSHMGMYIGNGLIVHAPNSSTVVKIVEIDHGNVYYGATTILH